MRAPNQQGCALSHTSKQRSIACVGDIIRHCTEYFETAAASEGGVEFRVTEDDCAALRALYPDHADTSLRLLALINEALADKQMRYRLGDLSENYALSFLFTVYRNDQTA